MTAPLLLTLLVAGCLPTGAAALEPIREAVLQWDLAISRYVYTVGFDRSGKHLMTGDNGGMVMIWDVQKGQVLKRSPEKGSIVAAGFILKDSQVIFDNLSALHLWNPADDKEPVRKIPELQKAHEYFAAVSADGSRFALLARDGLLIRNSKTDELIHELGKAFFETIFFCGAAFSPNGEILAAGSSDKEVILFDLRRGRELKRYLSPVGDVCHLSFSPDGTRLGAVTNDGTVLVWNVDSGRLIYNLKNPAEMVPYTARKSVQFSPDGNYLLTLNHIGYVKVWDLRSGQDARILPDAAPGALSAAFSPDGSLLVIGAKNRIQFWRIRYTKEELLQQKRRLLPLIPNPGGALAEEFFRFDWNGAKP